MNKQQFLDGLRSNLRRFPKADIEKSLEYYSELIDDSVEDGCTEEEAVANLGTIDEVIKQIIETMTAEQINGTAHGSKKGLKTWHKIVLICTSPIWLSLLFALVSLALCFVITAIALYISLWIAIISMYAAMISIAVGAFGGVFLAINLLSMNIYSAVFVSGCVLICLGVSIFGTLLMNLLTKLYVRFSALLFGICKRKDRRYAK